MGKEKGGHRAFLTSNRAKVSSAKIHRQQETTNKTQQTQQRQDQRRPAASKPAAILIDDRKITPGKITKERLISGEMMRDLAICETRIALETT